MRGTRKNYQTQWEHNLPATPSSSNWGQQLTAHATPHSKGAWSTVVASTGSDMYGFWISIAETRGANTRTDMMLDIATGPNQENIIVPEWLCGWRTSVLVGPSPIFFPIFIPRGTQISARIQALIASDTAVLLFFGHYNTSALPGRMFVGCDAYGTAAASSTGTSHTPGNSGADSTAANIGSTLAKNYGAVMLQVQGTLADTVMTNNGYHWKLVVGGSERTIWYTNSEVGERVTGPFPPTPFPMSLAAGEQLQIKAEAEGTAEAQDVAFYCFY